MKRIFSNICLFSCLIFCIYVNFGIAQGNPPGNPFYQSFEDFNKIVNYRSDKYLFRLFQFRGKYQNAYQYTEIKSDGKSFTFRHTPYAGQMGRQAVLSKEQIDELKQKLLDFSLPRTNQNIKPKENELFAAFVFQDEVNFVRLNFLGKIPSEIQFVLDLLNIEFEKAEKIEGEKNQAETRRLYEKYGEWEKTPGNFHSFGSGYSLIRNEKSALLYLKGHISPVKDYNQTRIPIYYAVIFYSKGSIISDCCGWRSDDPVSRNGVSWVLKNQSNKSKKHLILAYNAIEKNLEIKGRTYALKKGNLFVIKIDKNEEMNIKQLEIQINESKTHRQILNLLRKN